MYQANNKKLPKYNITPEILCIIDIIIVKDGRSICKCGDNGLSKGLILFLFVILKLYSQDIIKDNDFYGVTHIV